MSQFVTESENAAQLYENLKIQIKLDNKTNTIEITDNGIGMTQDHLEEFLGSIASSGTRKFKEQMAAENKSDQMKMIGQFGLGFYAAFIISKKVEVITRYPGHQQFKWTSEGVKEYTIEQMEADRENGTTIVLHIKEGDEEFLKPSKIKEVVKKHSAFISYPIFLEENVEKKVEKKDDEKVEEVTENENEAEKTEETPKTEEKVFETVNTKINYDTPLWKKNSKQITPEEYTAFYKQISNDWDEQLAVKHTTVQGGAYAFTFLLFCPKRNPTNFFMGDKNKKSDRLKLYAANVLITDDLSDIVPEWMTFITGCISTDDLPLNVSREFLQSDNVFKTLKRILSRLVREMMEEVLDSDKHEDFYKEYSDAIKLAIRLEDTGNAPKFHTMLRYSTNQSETPITFQTYVSRMKEGQKQIYILTGSSINELKESPFLSAYSDYEVLLMTDPSDEIMLQTFTKYENIPLQKIDTDGVEVPNPDKSFEEDFKPLSEKLKTLFDLERVEIRDLGEVPAIVTVPKYSYSSNMRRLMKSQPGSANNPLASFMATQKNILVISPSHQLIQKLKVLLEDPSADEELTKLSKLMYLTSLIRSGLDIENTKEYSSLIFERLV